MTVTTMKKEGDKEKEPFREVPPPFPDTPSLCASYYEFYKYLRKTKLMIRIEMVIFKLITKGITEEEDAVRIVRQCFGGIPQVNEDTAKISNAIDRCKERTFSYKAEMKEWILRYMDAVERSTNHDLFVDEELRAIETGTFNRAESLLKQFRCLTTMDDIGRLRDERAIYPPIVTASSRAAARREELFSKIADTDDIRDLQELEAKYLPSSVCRVREYNLKDLNEEEIVDGTVEEECYDDNVVDDF